MRIKLQSKTDMRSLNRSSQRQQAVQPGFIERSAQALRNLSLSPILYKPRARSLSPLLRLDPISRPLASSADQSLSTQKPQSTHSASDIKPRRAISFGSLSGKPPLGKLSPKAPQTPSSLSFTGPRKRPQVAGQPKAEGNNCDVPGRREVAVTDNATVHSTCPAVNYQYALSSLRGQIAARELGITSISVKALMQAYEDLVSASTSTNSNTEVSAILARIKSLEAREFAEPSSKTATVPSHESAASASPAASRDAREGSSHGGQVQFNYALAELRGHLEAKQLGVTTISVQKLNELLTTAQQVCPASGSLSLTKIKATITAMERRPSEPANGAEALSTLRGQVAARELGVRTISVCHLNEMLTSLLSEPKLKTFDSKLLNDVRGRIQILEYKTKSDG